MPPKKAVRQSARQQTKPRPAQPRRPTTAGVPTQVLPDGTATAEMAAECCGPAHPDMPVHTRCLET